MGRVCISATSKPYSEKHGTTVWKNMMRGNSGACLCLSLFTYFVVFALQQGSGRADEPISVLHLTTWLTASSLFLWLHFGLSSSPPASPYAGLVERHLGRDLGRIAPALPSYPRVVCTSRRRPLNASCMPKNQRPQGCGPLLPPMGERVLSPGRPCCGLRSGALVPHSRLVFRRTPLFFFS